MNTWQGAFGDEHGRAAAQAELQRKILESTRNGEPVYIVTQSKGAEIAYSVLSDPNMQRLIKNRNAKVTLVTMDTNAGLLVDAPGKKAEASLPGVNWVNVHYSPPGIRGDLVGANIDIKGVQNVELSKVPGVVAGAGGPLYQHGLAYQPENVDALVANRKIPNPAGSRVIAIPGTDLGETSRAPRKSLQDIEKELERFGERGRERIEDLLNRITN